MSNLNGTELISRLSDRSGVKRDTAKLMLSSLGIIVQEAIMAKGEVALPGIGKITSSERKARIGTSPADGSKINIAAKRVAKLKPSIELKQALAL